MHKCLFQQAILKTITPPHRGIWTYLVSIAHEVVYSDERFEDDDPRGVLRALDQQVGHLRDGYVRLERAVQQVCR